VSIDPNISDRMRADWNQRAREDAYYYVAFGRRDQNEEEFHETAAEVVASVEWEMKHLGPVQNPRALRALEIGCGPGRLMKPLSRNFGEIQGVDVSDEMIGLARARLNGIPHAHVHATDGATLRQFADESFDVVYSYAVFQHIPSRDVVIEYCREAQRIMKPGAIFRAQFNGLPATFPRYDTWSGVRFTAGELAAFTREYDFQVLALEGASTQYMWTTWRKRASGWRQAAAASAGTSNAAVRRITNAHNSEPVAPAAGRFASISAWLHHLPFDADLCDLELRVDGRAAAITYIGPPDNSGVQQVNAILPKLDVTGLLPVELRWFGRSIAPIAFLRVIPAGPQLPRVMTVSDGIDLMAGTRIETRSVKVTLEEVPEGAVLRAEVDGCPVLDLEAFCTDPLSCRYEVNFQIPRQIGTGAHMLQMSLGRRKFAPVAIEIAATGDTNRTRS
jgi:ubiquinone/menaquinone biosynthesis C-methylase UbiE